MDVKSLLRDPKAVQADLTTLSDKRVVTKKGCTICIPTRFIDRGIATIGVNNSTLGILAIITPDGKYSVMRVPSRLNIDPTSVSRVMIDNTDYTLFHFAPGSVVFKSTMCVKEDTLTYYIFDEFFMKGNIPWYISYDDLGKVFSTSEKYAGTTVAANRVAIELCVAHMARVKGDPTKFYRHTLAGKPTLKGDLFFIGLNDVSYAPSSTMYKLAGSYMDQGMVSAFNTTSTNIDRIEAIVRS